MQRSLRPGMTRPGIMPRIALVCLVLVGGCFFDADYSGGRLTCGDGICPADLECRQDLEPPVCRAPRQDAAVDTPMMDVIDARLAALTCNDPGVMPMTGGTAMGTTMGRTNMVAPMCNGSVHNGFDAVYRIDAAAGKQLNITITAPSFSATAYVVQPCGSANGCVGNIYAQPGVPINVTVLAGGPPFVVVDSTFSAMNGTYTLNVTVN